MYYNQLVCSLLFSSYTQKIYLLLYSCYVTDNKQHHCFHLHLHIIIHFTFMIILQTFWYYIIIVTVLQQIIHWHSNIKIFYIVYKCANNFWYAWSKWNIILKGLLFASYVIIISVCNSYCPFHNNKIWLNCLIIQIFCVVPFYNTCLNLFSS